MTLPQPKVEIRFDGTNWDDVTAWVRMPDGINLQRGRDDETGDPLSVGTCTLSLDNNEGEFTPGLTSSANYPYVVAGVAIRVSMWTGAAYSVRFYGTVQKWQVSWLNPVGTQAKVTVTATGTLGTFPSYTLQSASNEAIRTYANSVYHWPLLGEAGVAAAEPVLGSAALVVTGDETKWGTGAGPLPTDEAEGFYPTFTANAGGLRLLRNQDGSAWPFKIAGTTVGHVLAVLMGPPTAALTIFTTGRIVAWDPTYGIYLTTAGTGGAIMPTAWPAVVCYSSDTFANGGSWLRVYDADGNEGQQQYNPNVDYTAQVVVNSSTASGGSFSLGHLAMGTTPIASLSELGPALISRVTAAAPNVLAAAVGVTLTGTVDGETALPYIEGREVADVLATLATGTGARIIEDLDGTLTWQEFPPSGTPIALPAFEIDPEFTWETSDIGWTSDATVTWPDGSSYTATRPDGKRSSMSFEGVHADRDRDRSWADWLVWNTASTGQARMPAAPYDLATLSDADTATLASVTVGSRISLSGLPSQMPSTLTLIVEGIDEQITDSRWLVTFKTSPDVYSRLFILDDPVQSVLDAGYLLAP